MKIRKDKQDKMSDKLPEDWDEKYKIMRTYTVTFKDKTTRTIIANRFIENNHGEVTFRGAPDNSYDAVAFFTNVESVVLAVNGRVYPEPVKGVEYYTLEDMRRALTDLHYTDSDRIIDGVRKCVSVRDDGRYSIAELKTAATQTDHTSGYYYAKRFEEAALQARKNRVFDAHTRS